MSTPLQYYQSLPPVSKTYAVICLMTSGAYHLQLYKPLNIALFYADVFKRFQIWRLITNFFFIGQFSLTFAFRFLIILRYGVSLERGPFDKRAADYLWMFISGALSLLVMAAVPFLWSPFMGASLVFMIVYVWGRELPNARVNFYGLVELKGFYLPWSMLAVDLLLGNPLKPDILGIAAGHLHKLVAFWGEGIQMNTPVKNDAYASSGTAFKGRSYRLGGDTSTSSRSQSSTPRQEETSTSTQSNSASGVAFRGKSYRLGAN